MISPTMRNKSNYYAREIITKFNYYVCKIETKLWNKTWKSNYN